MPKEQDKLKQQLIATDEFISELEEQLEVLQSASCEEIDTCYDGKSTVLYGCQTLTISQASLNRIKAFELRYLRKLLGIKYHHHRTNESVLQEVKNASGPFTRLDPTVIKLKWFGHVARHQDSYFHQFLDGMVPGSRPRGRPRHNWFTNIKDWTNDSYNSLPRCC